MPSAQKAVQNVILNRILFSWAETERPGDGSPYCQPLHTSTQAV